ncbi:MAG: Xaa-Pro peptidase family protein [Paraglaciecola sp.]|uniref:M24 family metallopeptidase n=1 Tax=Paraglaciecola sp. TaxID=1920173 RepID=UPI00326468E7
MTSNSNIQKIRKILHFSRDEYESRLKNIRLKMQEENLDLLLLSDPCNIYYATGYDAWSFYVPQCALISASNDEPVWIGREMDRHGARLTSILSDNNIVAYDDKYVQSQIYHPMSVMASEIRERYGNNIHIGIEMDSYYIDIQAYLKLQTELPNCKVSDASLLVNWVRAVKSPTEIGYMHEAATLVQNAMQSAIDLIQPNVRECDVAATAYSDLVSSNPDFAGSYTSTPPLIPAGERLNTPHLSWNSSRYQNETQINLELMACRNRYHMPLGRSVYLGTPPANLQTIESAIVEGLDAALDFIKPGVMACEVEATWQKAAAKYNVQKSARCGYALGIAYPPTCGEKTISLRPDDKTILEEGMTFHLMPAIWHEGNSLVITEPFAVTKSGAETFCNFPRKLFVK